MDIFNDSAFFSGYIAFNRRTITVGNITTIVQGGVWIPTGLRYFSLGLPECLWVPTVLLRRGYCGSFCGNKLASV